MKLASKIVHTATAKLLASVSMQDILKYKSRQAKDAPHKPVVYVAAMPKSAGTFICKTIADTHKIPYLHFTDREGCCEFDIYHPGLLKHLSDGGIVHQHTLGTAGNIYYLHNYNIPCVVLTRNIYDALYSFYEHLEQYKNTWPMFEYPAGYFTMEQDAKMDFLVTAVVPWFLQFYIAWYKAQQDKKISLRWITYEAFVKEPVQTINRIEELLGIPVMQQIKEMPPVKENETLRVNKAVTGRGVAMIPAHHKIRIQQMMAFYPEVDFGLIS